MTTDRAIRNLLDSRVEFRNHMRYSTPEQTNAAIRAGQLHKATTYVSRTFGTGLVESQKMVDYVRSGSCISTYLKEPEKIL